MHKDMLDYNEMYQLLRSQKMRILSDHTGIKQSTLKNYKYGKIPLKHMPLQYAYELTKFHKRINIKNQ